MSHLFLRVLHMSLTAGFVILAVMAVRCCLWKAPRIYSYALWSVVLFRLLCPVSFESGFSLIPEGAVSLRQQMVSLESGSFDGRGGESGAFPGMAGEMEEAGGENGVGAYPEAGMDQDGDGKQQTDSGHMGGGLPAWLRSASFIWAAGAAAMAIFNGVSLYRLKKRLRSARMEQENIYRSDEIDTPFVMGIRKPSIYLPSGLSAEERSYILLHEQIHIRRHDPFIKAAACAALCIHWFNPLVWAAFYQSVQDMEMSCDEAVVLKLGNGVKKEYSTSLLRFAAGCEGSGRLPAAFGEGDTKKRIKHVLDYKKPAFWMAGGAVAVVILALAGLASDPGKPEPEKGYWEELYSYRTQYLGDNVKTGAIFSYLFMPEGFESRGIALKTDQRPYYLEINYSAGESAVKQAMEEPSGLHKNSILLFSLIGNLDGVKININGEEQAVYSRRWAEGVMGTDPWASSGSLEDFKNLCGQADSRITGDNAVFLSLVRTEARIKEIDSENKFLRVEGLGTNNFLGDNSRIDCKYAYFTEQTEEGEREITLEELEPGDSVSVYHGLVKEIYPTETEAGSICRTGKGVPSPQADVRKAKILHKYLRFSSGFTFDYS